MNQFWDVLFELIHWFFIRVDVIFILVDVLFIGVVVLGVSLFWLDLFFVFGVRFIVGLELNRLIGRLVIFVDGLGSFSILLVCTTDARGTFLPIAIVLCGCGLSIRVFGFGIRGISSWRWRRSWLAWVGGSSRRGGMWVELSWRLFWGRCREWPTRRSWNRLGSCSRASWG